MTIVRYFKCPICSKTTPLDNLEIPEETEGVFAIQEREAAGRAGFPTIGEYAVTEESDIEDEELLISFAQKIAELYKALVEMGYIPDEDDDDE